ncbi:MAG: hypothetical protein A3F72_13540 [Bacteroidetes bacterium RIFCSPLOWO2_12_FULL_35_15]|nr:MAG: hypothetical protein A3F72_13540 [Bacteroidetes bacterium RIFCSPLOWO2_12_FULL_35_15]
MKKHLYILSFIFVMLLGSSSGFGQTYTQTNGIAYSWYSPATNISTTNADDVGFTLTIPFTFAFFGTNYTSCYVSTNGLMYFGATGTEWTNACMPAAAAPNNVIAAYWDDLYFDYGCAPTVWRYETTGSSPNRVFNVAWVGFISTSGSCGTYVYTEIKLFETSNIIEVHLQSNALGSSGTIGIENAAGTVAYQAICNGATAPPYAWRWNPCSAPSTQASNLTFSAVTCSGMIANWTNGTGAKRIVKCNTSNSFTAPVDGTDPAANAVFGGSEQVVYNGTGTSVAVTGLTAGATYWYRVYEANCSGTSIKFNTSTSTDNPLSQAANPATPATPGAITGTITQCQNATGQTYSISAVSNASTYTWTLPAGAWSVTGGAGTISITATAGNAGQNGNITVTAGNSCGTSAAATLAVTVAAASTPIAGPDQYICSATTSATMAASGTGTWTQVTGAAATITTPTSASSTITGLASGTYVFRWTAGCGGVYDDVIIIRQ